MHSRPENTYIRRCVSSPNVRVHHESQDGIGAAPFCHCPQILCRKDWEPIDCWADPLGQRQSMQAVYDILPRLVVWIGQAVAGRVGGKESMDGGDVVVAESWEEGNHRGLV